MTSTVSSSIFVADFRKPYSPSDVPGSAGLTMSSTAATTASAVNGSPLWKVTPWRSLKRQVVGSGLVQLSASSGTIFGSPEDQSRKVRWS
jgi:hypothetical protein